MCGLRTIFSTDLVWYRVFTAAEHVCVCNYVFLMLMLDIRGTEEITIPGKTWERKIENNTGLICWVKFG